MRKRNLGIPSVKTSEGNIIEGATDDGLVTLHSGGSTDFGLTVRAESPHCSVPPLSVKTICSDASIKSSIMVSDI